MPRAISGRFSAKLSRGYQTRRLRAGVKAALRPLERALKRDAQRALRGIAHVTAEGVSAGREGRSRCAGARPWAQSAGAGLVEPGHERKVQARSSRSSRSPPMGAKRKRGARGARLWADTFTAVRASACRAPFVSSEAATCCVVRVSACHGTCVSREGATCCVVRGP